MTLATFYSRVSAAMRRGTSLDAQIPLWAKEAAREMEQNYTFSWMRKSSVITLNANTNPSRVAFPGDVKSFEWIKVAYAGDEGTKDYRKLLGVDVDQITSIDQGYISGYWLDGVDYINFDAVVTEDTSLLLRWNQYTAWPVDTSQTPVLLARAEGVLLAETMIIFAVENRDNRLAAEWAQVRQDRMNRLLRSEEDLKMDHQNDLSMRLDMR